MLQSFEGECCRAGAGATNQKISAHQFSDQVRVFAARAFVRFRAGVRPFLGDAGLEGLDGSARQQRGKLGISGGAIAKLKNRNDDVTGWFRKVASSSIRK